MTSFTVTASPVDDLDKWPPLHTFNVRAETTADAVNLATRLLGTKSPGLAVRSVVPKRQPDVDLEISGPCPVCDDATITVDGCCYHCGTDRS